MSQQTIVIDLGGNSLIRMRREQLRSSTPTSGEQVSRY